ncbi:MAG: hypothetical protein SRB2_02065 [Desulfobacteraceae bacterium Eth-SRB2]|nr:MAG: hypothetical protein SRB2_02065 [Desulfobacteraceae bacterium Eth-SRB2]
MLNNGLLLKRDVAEAIKLTPSHTTTLARRLRESGARSLVDRRQGQKQEYRVPAPVNAELVQQFAVDIITSGKTSGSKISTELKERCKYLLPVCSPCAPSAQIKGTRIEIFASAGGAG